MPTRTLQAGAAPQKYGVVVVDNPNGSINRQFRITEAEYRALAQPGAGAPSGVTNQEWRSGRARAYGKDYDIGDAQVRGDGSVLIKLDEVVVDKAIVETFIRFSAGEWTGQFPAITVAPAVLAAMDLSESRRITAVDSVIAGVVTWR